MNNPRKCTYVNGPLIVGAGPSGLAVSACLKEKGVSSLILERSNCICYLWKNKAYDRLRLHLPKQFCELPHVPFPEHFPAYPDKHQFLAYLDSYAEAFQLRPVFHREVVSAEFDKECCIWRIWTAGCHKQEEVHEYVSKWLIVASGENNQENIPKFDGVSNFVGPILHTSSYKSGEAFCRKKVLVVGCGNSGMEVCLDLCNYSARPSLVVWNSVHILPLELMGISTFALAMGLLKWFPIRIVYQFLLLLARLMLGDTAKHGLNRPKLGPLQLKQVCGKTPILDIGTLAKIKSGHIKDCREIRRLGRNSVEFVDGKVEDFDAIILATSYKSNVPSWLKEYNMFSEDGFPRKPFPNGWKGENGLYAVGFSRSGLLGASLDAERVAEDIEQRWKNQQC